MKILHFNLAICLTVITFGAFAQKNTTYQLASPDGKNVIKIDVGKTLQWSVAKDSTEVIAPSAISMQLQTEVLGSDVKIISAKIVRAFA